MKKNIILIVFALLLLGGCKKDEKVRIYTITEKTPTVDVAVTSVSIRGDYWYPSDLKSVTVAYTQNSDYSSASTILAENHNVYGAGDYYYARLIDLEPGTTYYYYCIFDTGYGSTEGKQWSFTTQSVSATAVTTSSVSNITHTTATCGGEVTSDGGSTVTARGVCWGTSQDPTVSNSHTTDGTGTGSFTSSITGLTENTTYYVRAYATNSAGTSYGEQKSFTTHGAIAGHEYVDLSLPSGALWATCNVGADSPEDYGDYFAWGETTTKSTYDWSTYKWCNGSANTLTKYCTKSNYGTVDDKTILDPEDDAAHVNWGGDWRMPTRAELQELYDNTTRKWTTENGVRGYKFTSKTDSDKYIFLPAAGYRSGTSLNSAGSSGLYWSSSLKSSDPSYAYYMTFSSNSVTPQYSYFRNVGFSVRPVYAQSISAPAVTTSSVSNISQTTATCGGNVTSDGGAAVTARGVCWSTSQNPTVSDSHTTDGSGTGSFTSSITGLTENTTYYVRAYATNSAGTSYGEQMNFTTQSVSIPTVTTAQVSNITLTTAICGGDVTSDGGATVATFGVCWSTSPDPTVSDSHTDDFSFTSNFTSFIIGLTANTTYYVRAYATNSVGTSYGEQESFTTRSAGDTGNHEYVDLGLPSGLLWATCNVGAGLPEDYGYHYAWGETETKSRYSWSTYKWCNGSYNTLTKYNTNSNYGIVDNKTVLDPEDDAAYVNWGGDWRMPTSAEWQELYDNTTLTKTKENGVRGIKFESKIDDSKYIFLPVAGYIDGTYITNAGFDGSYWSSSLSTDSDYPTAAHCMDFDWSFGGSTYPQSAFVRDIGLSVRPVCPSRK